jgi:single-strand DNA-binding protein
MSGFNRVVLMGNLTRDPQVKQTPSGQSVADIGLATNEAYRNKEGDTVEKVIFVDIVAWGRQADACGQYLSKGRPVLVEGRLQFDQWENNQGERRNKLRVRAGRIQFLNARRDLQTSPPVTNMSERVETGGDEIPF